MGDARVLSSLGEEAKAEVDAVLRSTVFVRSPRLAHLLKYLCSKYFAGESDQIKEYHIAVEVLDRPESFDPAQDAIARVEVHRLRKRLREYYDTEGIDHPLRIVIPIGQYAPSFISALADEHAHASNVNDSAAALPAFAADRILPAVANGAAVVPVRPWQGTSLRLAGGITLCAVCSVLLWLFWPRTTPVSGSENGHTAASVMAPPVT